MPFKCPNYGCPHEFKNTRGLAEHDARWCKYKANSTRQHLDKRKAELQAESDAKRARYELDEQTRSQADNVSVSNIFESMYTFINTRVHYQYWAPHLSPRGVEDLQNLQQQTATAGPSVRQPSHSILVLKVL